MRFSGIRDRSRFSGSIFSKTGVTVEFWRYVLEVIINRCIDLMLQPWRTNSEANQSSSSEWVGRAPVLPKFARVFTIPVPKWCFQIRFTMTREVSGWSGRINQRAKAKRRPVLLEPGQGGCTSKGVLPSVSTDGTPGPTNRPKLAGSPRRKM